MLKTYQKRLQLDPCSDGAAEPQQTAPIPYDDPHGLLSGWSGGCIVMCVGCSN